MRSNRIWYPRIADKWVHYLVITGSADNWNGAGPTWQVFGPQQNAYHHLSVRHFAYVSTLPFLDRVGINVRGFAAVPKYGY